MVYTADRDGSAAAAVRLRPATAEDVGGVLALWSIAAENAGRPSDTRDAVGRLLARDPDALLLAVDETDRVIGTIIVGFDGWRCHLYRLAVHPDARRQGVGRLLLEHAEQRLRDLGGTRIDAMVLEQNQLGQRVWGAAGYTEQDDWRRWVKPITDSA
ncbi:GNAT family N-acetyltransferase [Solicola gregarius]|uniref:GNAT family N-acetyltransferase n=1 Tax=Solicola gregarius TaxID=2908642 RepID=A0AA46TLX5_9ACTN|nr:GNAT family N-acetyltransferase [Solicola gregarius]UYM07548.1 GNAT family N-acetyltransferase [Solicola gregarius]